MGATGDVRARDGDMRLFQLKGAGSRGSAKAEPQRPDMSEAFVAKNHVISAYRAARIARYTR